MTQRVFLPIVERAVCDEQYQLEEHEPFGSSPHLHWCRHYEVTLGNANRLVRKHRWSKPSPDQVGELFGFTVCSPAYMENPRAGAEVPQYLARALVQDVLDENAAFAYLHERVNEIGPVSPDEAGHHFRKFLNTEEWDYMEWGVSPPFNDTDNKFRED